jgi:hypothetical protein
MMLIQNVPVAESWTPKPTPHSRRDSSRVSCTRTRQDPTMVIIRNVPFTELDPRTPHRPQGTQHQGCRVLGHWIWCLFRSQTTMRLWLKLPCQLDPKTATQDDRMLV